jgi:thioredoxin reductase (NADPH)
MYDVLIIGGGPAGITAAIYCARSNLKVALIDKGLIGGNPLNYLEIQNYPGLPGTTENLVDKFLEHLDLYKNIERFEFEEITEIDLKEKIVKTTNYDFKGKKIIIATGSKPRMLGIPGEEEHIGHGVHYCAICDGPLYKDKTVAVIGGGNSACEEALGLSKICKKVYIIEFTDKLNCEKTTLDKINNTENITVFTRLRVDEILGDEYVTGIKTYPVKGYANFSQLNVEGVFVYIGMSPNLPEADVPELENGYIKVNENMETSCPDVYAIGDITNKKYRQVITAMSDGAIAAIHISKNI